MKKMNLFFRVGLFLPIILTILCCYCHAQVESLNVGVFQNKPIVYFENGAKGLFVDVLNHIAEKEGWKIEYVHCKLGECLDLLKNNQLQLVVSLGESPERLKSFLFSKKPVWTFWGTVYSSDPKVNSIFDLADRKIAVRGNNKITLALKNLTAKFNITHIPHPQLYELAYFS